MPQDSSVRTGSHRTQAGQAGSVLRPGLPGWKVCRQRPLDDQAQVPQVCGNGAIPNPSGWIGSRTPWLAASRSSESRSSDGGDTSPRRSACSKASESSRSWNPGGDRTGDHSKKRDRPCMAAVSWASLWVAASRADSVASGHQRAADSVAVAAQSRSSRACVENEGAGRMDAERPSRREAKPRSSGRTDASFGSVSVSAFSWRRSAWRCCRAGHPASPGSVGIRPGWPGMRRVFACRGP